MIDISKAKDATVVRNHAADPSYTPYCLRCAGLHRMSVVEPFYFRHSCGAEHDERQCIVADSSEVRGG